MEQRLFDGTPGEYAYEAWHWRYLGIPIATRLHELGLSYNEWDAAL